MKIRFVQLEADAFLTDIDFIQMSPAERGVYCSLILFLTSNGGTCRFDPPALSRLCNCERPEVFESIWERLGRKFQTRNGVIRHKRVTRELGRARRLLRAKRQAGLAGARKRWHSDGNANAGAAAKERKRNVIETETQDPSNTNTTEPALSASSPVRPRPSASSHIRALHFNEALVNVIRPRTQSDRTCFQNVAHWLIEGCARGRFDESIFDRVLDYAREARQGRRPAAVFMALLKKELRYRHDE
jgi:uncharacterized protein YdaU (DUF1376 family)